MEKQDVIVVVNKMIDEYKELVLNRTFHTDFDTQSEVHYLKGYSDAYRNVMDDLLVLLLNLGAHEDE